MTIFRQSRYKYHATVGYLILLFVFNATDIMAAWTCKLEQLRAHLCTRHVNSGLSVKLSGKFKNGSSRRRILGTISALYGRTEENHENIRIVNQRAKIWTKDILNTKQ
jgi:hypothetical protein